MNTMDLQPHLMHLDPISAITQWLEILGVLVVTGLVFSFVYSTAAHRNPIEGIKRTLRGLLEGFRDIVLLPFGLRRVWAISLLSLKEAIRRRVLYVFVFFLIPFLFAGWYLPNSEEGQIQFLVAFINNAITWLLLPLVVFLVSMSLPNDLKYKTIQTVVTKPIRRLEIVIGRILGFTIIFSAVLFVMGTVSLWYLWGNVSQEVKEQQWTARVPIFATPPNDEFGPLMFKKKGQWTDKGTDIGNEYRYRSHIEGNGSDEAHWFFQFDPNAFAGGDVETVRLEMTFDIFRTTKGDPSRTVGEGAATSGVWCQMFFYDSESRERVHEETFRVNNNRKNILNVPADIFKTGKLTVVATCLARNQFIGMAPYDLYILASEKSFSVNFVKGMISIWLKVVLLTCVAVSASTVLNGFVSILFTAMIYILGFFYDFLTAVIRGDVQGGGPIESFIRIVTQNNQQNPLEPNVFISIALSIDSVVLMMMDTLSRVIPNLTTIDTVQFVAAGFDIPLSYLVANVLAVAGYTLPVMILGYFFLRNREIASTS